MHYYSIRVLKDSNMDLPLPVSFIPFIYSHIANYYTFVLTEGLSAVFFVVVK